MEGMFFYWILWISWVVLMFFVKDTYQPRYAILFHLLAIMCLAAYELHIYRYTINISFIYLFFICSFYIRNFSLAKTMGFIIGCLIIALGYNSIQLFALLDPIWLVVRVEWILGIVMNYLAIILFQDWKLRICALVDGLIIGESLYAGALCINNLPYAAGSYAWMDMATLIMVLHFAWVLLEYTTCRIHAATVHQHVKKGTAAVKEIRVQPK
ncbi:hypothetical protein [Bacillus sp. V5-8f]|uniref:YphA family membrane protein n=1 Tax=Bacillus sp. V5-8f TaxID=2053044 RepID=UPI000C764453|nr:hypothetical protein [Bacillus sp. V5-8f]PLT34862.1 hypothetical protein CUU64_05515 [Bacillus sp. V5-8f]